MLPCFIPRLRLVKSICVFSPLNTNKREQEKMETVTKCILKVRGRAILVGCRADTLGFSTFEPPGCDRTSVRKRSFLLPDMAVVSEVMLWWAGWTNIPL